MSNNGELGQEGRVALFRLTVAAILIFGIVLVIGAILGFVVYAALIGLILAILFSLPLSRRLWRMEYPPAERSWMVFSLILFVGTVAAVIALIDQVSDPVVRNVIAFLPSVALALFIYSIGRAIAALDELQRRIQLEGIAIGFGLFAIIAFAYGFLGLAGVSQEGWLFAAPMMALCWLVGKLWTLWRYR